MKKSAQIMTSNREIREARTRLRIEGVRLAFTNGVFDLLHIGHLRYLQAAAALADVFWVGLNSDQSVRAIKGKQRPIIPWAERAELLAALAPIDGVLFFDELTADHILRLVEPDLYIKGGDYTPQTLPEAPTAQAIGAELHLLPFTKGRSTTQLIQSIQQRPAKS